MSLIGGLNGLGAFSPHFPTLCHLTSIAKYTSCLKKHLSSSWHNTGHKISDKEMRGKCLASSFQLSSRMTVAYSGLDNEETGLDNTLAYINVLSYKLKLICCIGETGRQAIKKLTFHQNWGGK